jgi:hypothetical protein
MRLESAVVVGLAVALAGCKGSSPPATTLAPTPVFINPLPAPMPIPSPPAPASNNGTVTWISIVTSRALCNEITKQVGDSWRVRLAMSSSGNLVRVSIWEGPPEWEPAAQFDGVRDGDVVTAARNKESPSILACPRDLAGTPQTGGDLTMTISGNEVTGKYSEIFGTGPDRATFNFSVQATLD